MMMYVILILKTESEKKNTKVLFCCFFFCSFVLCENYELQPPLVNIFVPSLRRSWLPYLVYKCSLNHEQGAMNAAVSGGPGVGSVCSGLSPIIIFSSVICLTDVSENCKDGMNPDFGLQSSWVVSLSADTNYPPQHQCHSTTLIYLASKRHYCY